MFVLLSVRGATLTFMAFSFFFQAEDGIRDYKVTGVQTCALPISRLLREFLSLMYSRRRRGSLSIEWSWMRYASRNRRIVSEIGRASCRERGEMSGVGGLERRKRGRVGVYGRRGKEGSSVTEERVG